MCWLSAAPTAWPPGSFAHAALGWLVLRYPVPTGPRSYQVVSASVPITGTHTSPLRFLSYANQPAAAAMSVSCLVNQISLAPATGYTAADVKRALLAMPAVTAVEGAAAITDAVDQTMSQFTDVLVITVAIAMIMALLVAYNAAAINAEERTRETATMFASGITSGIVIADNVLEAFLVAVLATILGVAAGYAILRWIIDVSMRSTMPDLGTLVSISAGTCGLAALAGMVSVTAAPLLTLRRLRRTDVPSPCGSLSSAMSRVRITLTDCVPGVTASPTPRRAGV